MSFGRKNLILRRIGRFYIPFYLGDEHEDLIKEIIGIYEDCIGKPLRTLDKELIIQIIGNEKLARGLIHVMRYFYRPKRPKETTISPKRLRIKVFELANKLYNGFVPSDRRKEFIEIIKKELGIEDELDLWADEEEELLLYREREVRPEDIIKAYNFEVIDTIFTYASEVMLKYRGLSVPKGYIAKLIARYAKMKGLLYDMKIEDGVLITKVYGPIEVFGKPTKYGEGISDVMFRVLVELKDEPMWEVWARVHFKRAVLNVLVLSGNEVPLIDMHREPCSNVYDSSLERRIENALKSIGFHVVREPEPIILSSSIMVPDFIIEKDGRKAYLEVAGYWRDKYAERKASKLIQLARLLPRIPLIVLAEEKLRRYLPEISKIPIIYYRSQGSKVIIPYGKLMLAFKEVSSYELTSSS
ncbi:MAG: hypothetical protein DRJ66_03875 [Thermoprotei archaeon]|nr:MAG: hypothetical protein DRJ66_03875 [Thermoprotei archaeon]